MSGSDRRAGRRSDFLPFSIQIPKERPEIDVDDVLEFFALQYSNLVRVIQHRLLVWPD